MVPVTQGIGLTASALGFIIPAFQAGVSRSLACDAYASRFVAIATKDPWRSGSVQSSDGLKSAGRPFSSNVD